MFLSEQIRISEQSIVWVTTGAFWRAPRARKQNGTSIEKTDTHEESKKTKKQQDKQDILEISPPPKNDVSEIRVYRCFTSFYPFELWNDTLVPWRVS